MNERQIEPAGEKDFGPCGCCGGMSRSAWGYVYRSGVAEAAYFVQWTVGHVAEHGAHVDLIIGLWGEGSNRQDRVAVSMEFKRTKEGPQLMVIDSSLRPVAKSELVGRLLARSDVIGTSLAQQAYDIVDCLWIDDRRLSEISSETTKASALTRTRDC